MIFDLYRNKPIFFLFDLFGFYTIIGLFIIRYLDMDYLYLIRHLHMDYTYLIHYYAFFLLSSLFIFHVLLVYKKKEKDFYKPIFKFLPLLVLHISFLNSILIDLPLSGSIFTMITVFLFFSSLFTLILLRSNLETYEEEKGFLENLKEL